MIRELYTKLDDLALHGWAKLTCAAQTTTSTKNLISALGWITCGGVTLFNSLHGNALGSKLVTYATVAASVPDFLYLRHEVHVQDDISEGMQCKRPDTPAYIRLCQRVNEALRLPIGVVGAAEAVIGGGDLALSAATGSTPQPLSPSLVGHGLGLLGLSAAMYTKGTHQMVEGPERW